METTRFKSQLDDAPARFLSEVVEHALSSGLRTAADFIRHFPPGAMMEALASQPRLRAGLLTVVVGLRERTALRMPVEDAGRLLQAAMEEGDADVEEVAQALDPDDRVRYLDARRLWAFVTEGEFWKVSRSRDPQGHKKAQTHVVAILDRAMAHGLTSQAALVEGISLEVLAEKLPRAELAKILRTAVDRGRQGAPFSSADLLDASSLSVIADHVALPHVFDTIIAPIARSAGLVEGDRAEVTASGDDADAVMAAFDRVIGPTPDPTQLHVDRDPAQPAAEARPHDGGATVRDAEDEGTEEPLFEPPTNPPPNAAAP